MFGKGSVIFSESIGVCRVADLVNLSVNKQLPTQYYLLESIFQKKKTSYIPVTNHQVVLRNLLSVEEANEKKKENNLSDVERKEIEYVLGM